MFQLKKSVVLNLSSSKDLCYGYAVSELQRLLNRIGCSSEVKTSYAADSFLLGIDTAEIMKPDGVVYDGFRIMVKESSALFCAKEPKGILNAVYEFAEMLGFAFLFPGEKGEWTPEKIFSPEEGNFLRNPRFPHRGLFFSTTDLHSYEEHVLFMAKLKFNIVRMLHDDEKETDLYRKTGMRREIGQHDLPKFLDRKLFGEHPEYFRMFQPEDFNGKRTPDANYCITNPATRRIIAEKFQERIKRLPSDTYAVHAWPDDLPGSGWCMCPSCRSYSPTNQHLLSEKLLCRAADAAGSKLRISFGAYHDTVFPDKTLSMDQRLYLQWAPRERCYAHSLNDPACALNSIYMQGLQQWHEYLKEQKCDDAHTFEYYCDQLLFVGLYPYLPETLAGDAKVYEENGIESFMTLQVSSWGIRPDYNELFFAAVNWDRALDRKKFNRYLSRQIAGKDAAVFEAYLENQAEVFQNALLMCGHDFHSYLDYRWLPEVDTPFARKSAQAYADASKLLAQGAIAFEKALSPDSSRFHDFAMYELKRSLFEVYKLLSMHFQQAAMVQLGKANAENSKAAAEKGCELLKKEIEAEETAAKLAKDADYPATGHYLGRMSPWSIKEARDKIAKYSDFSEI